MTMSNGGGSPVLVPGAWPRAADRKAPISSIGSVYACNLVYTAAMAGSLPPKKFCYLRCVRTIVRKQAVTLGLGMVAGIFSFAVGSLIQNMLHVDGSSIALPLCFSLFLLVLKYGPDGWR